MNSQGDSFSQLNEIMSWEETIEIFHKHGNCDIFAIEKICNTLGRRKKFMDRIDSSLGDADSLYGLEEINTNFNDRDSRLCKAFEFVLSQWLEELGTVSNDAAEAYKSLCKEIQQRQELRIPQMDLAAESCVHLRILEQYKVVRWHPGARAWEARVLWFTLGHQNNDPG